LGGMVESRVDSFSWEKMGGRKTLGRQEVRKNECLKGRVAAKELQKDRPMFGEKGICVREKKWKRGSRLGNGMFQENNTHGN